MYVCIYPVHTCTVQCRGEDIMIITLSTTYTFCQLCSQILPSNVIPKLMLELTSMALQTATYILATS